MAKSLRHWSRVSSKNNKSSHAILWLIAAATIILLAWYGSTSISSHEMNARHNLLGSRQFNSELSANLNQLSKLTHMKSSQPIAPVNNNSQLRQHAPTMMYSKIVKSAQHTSGVLFRSGGINSRFANQQAIVSIVSASRMAHPQSTIASGELIHAVLETAINSDLPGMVRAVVTSPVYSYTAEQLLIPSGTRLIGQYTAVIVRGQRRVMVVWNRLLRPDGVAVELNSPSTDTLGRAGQSADAINRHFMSRFGESVLLSLLGAGASTFGVANADQYNSVAQYRMAIMQSMQQASANTLQQSQALKPTLRIHQGTNINVFVARDLDFYTVSKRGYK